MSKHYSGYQGCGYSSIQLQILLKCGPPLLCFLLRRAREEGTHFDMDLPRNQNSPGYLQSEVQFWMYLMKLWSSWKCSLQLCIHKTTCFCGITLHVQNRQNLMPYRKTWYSCCMSVSCLTLPIWKFPYRKVFNVFFKQALFFRLGAMILYNLHRDCIQRCLSESYFIGHCTDIP